MRKPVVIDFETQKSFREAPNPRDLKISVAGLYDYATDELRAFEEHELSDMFPYLENASLIIGFNLDSFDMPVLAPYYPGDIFQLKTFDILTDIKRLLGHRLRLDDVVSATLGEGKSGHGLRAIELFREGKLDELKKYCLDDVRLTRDLFNRGVETSKIFYPSNTPEAEPRQLHVQWERHMRYQGLSDSVNLSLPF